MSWDVVSLRLFFVVYLYFLVIFQSQFINVNFKSLNFRNLGEKEKEEEEEEEEDEKEKEKEKEEPGKKFILDIFKVVFYILDYNT